MELKARKDMDPRFMWDYTDIFKSSEEWETAFKDTEKRISGIPSFQGTLGNNAAALQTALDSLTETEHRALLVYAYASLHKAGDNGDPDYQSMDARATTLMVKLDSASAFVTPEILAIPEKTLNAFMASGKLDTYRHIIDNICRARAHTLDASGEQMLAKLSDAAQTPENSFTMLSDVDMTFPSITDENGNEAPLTHGLFPVYRESAERRVRKEAFETYFGEYKRYINTFTAMYSGCVKLDCFSADVRGFDSACEAALFSGNVPLSVYDSLTSAVHDGFDGMKRYIDLRKKAMDIDELNMYDMYNPLIKGVDFPMPLDEGKTLVKKALAPLGKEYSSLLDKAFSERWMDVYENKGKTTGAFSFGVYGVHPFVLLNYAGMLNDAFTIAHELGHAMHSFFSSRAQDFANHSYRIMVAEVASTVNEVLLSKHLLSTEKDKKRRAYVLNHLLEGFRTTVFRQTLFAEFERRAHGMYEQGQPLTAKSLNALYRELNEQYYEGAVINEFFDVEWARIPHFYNSFYVYQYATGFLSAVAIAENILKTGDPSNYLKFLCTGGSDYPLEELKIAGVDLTNPDSMRSSLEVFRNCVTELETLIGEIK